MSDLWALPAFFAIKGLAYVLYCYGGAAWFRRQMGNRWLRAGGFALLRIGIGLAFGRAAVSVLSVCLPAYRPQQPAWYSRMVWLVDLDIRVMLRPDSSH